MSDRPPPAVAGNLQLLEQAGRLLGALDDTAYAGAVRGHSSVGAQYRHVLDHYTAFLRGVGTGLVDYDDRERAQDLETDRMAAVGATRRIITGLVPLTERDLDRMCHVRLAASTDDRDPAIRTSSLGRELLFLVSHTVHHFAIIRLLLEGQDAVLDPGFGLAPSTALYQAARA